MTYISLTCEVLTPMFLGGAEPNYDDPEFRVASFRGALRWWLRALLAGQGHVNLNALRQEESRVFGSTEVGSPVRVRVSGVGPVDASEPHTIPGFEDTHPDNQNRPYHERRQPSNPEIRYLWYAITLGNNKRKYIPPETQFTLRLSAMPDRPGSTESRDALVQAVRALWLLSFCGGVGMRSRRAAGSFRVTEVENPGGLPIPEFEPSGEFADWFRGQLDTLGLVPSTSQPLFASLSTGYSQIWMLRRAGSAPFRRWDTAVGHAGAKMREFRLKRGRGTGGDYDQVRDFLSSVSSSGPAVGPTAVERASFGLPLTFRFKSAPNLGFAQINPDGLKRRASPLWMSVNCDTSGSFILIVTWFDAEFLPSGKGLTIKGGGTGKPFSLSPSLVPAFISTLGPTRLL